MGAFYVEVMMTKAEFLRHLKACRTYLPRQTILTLRGQALSGDVDGAVRGLTHILKKRSIIIPPSA